MAEPPSLESTSSVVARYPDINAGHPEMYWHGVFVTVVSGIAFATPFAISFPGAASIQIISLGVLTSVGYGIVNDQLACRQCIHYFTVGHTAIHRRLLRTERAFLNGVVWGIHATWREGVIGGVLTAIAARTPGLIPITAVQLLPYACIIAIGTCYLADWQARLEERTWNLPERRELLNQRFSQQITPLPGFHPVDLRRVPEERRAAYLGVRARNLLGYRLMPACSLALVIGTIAVRVFATFF